VEKHPHIEGRAFAGWALLGAADGLIEAMAATLALNMAGVEYRAIIIAGLALAIGGALSLFQSSYLSARLELDLMRLDVQRERMEIDTEPEEERRELEELLREEGYSPKEVDVIVKRVTSDRELWLRTQLLHELHLHMDELRRSPLREGALAGASFFIASALLVTPYALAAPRRQALLGTALAPLLALFIMGATGLLSRHAYSFRRGILTALTGGIVAGVVFLLNLALG